MNLCSGEFIDIQVFIDISLFLFNGCLITIVPASSLTVEC